MKIGKSKDDDIRARIESVNARQHDDSVYILLAGFRGIPDYEARLHSYFAAWRQTNRGRHKEYYWPSDELAEYANWLRQQWWVTIDPRLQITEGTDWSAIAPTAERRAARPPEDPNRLFQMVSFHGPIAGTDWDWMATRDLLGDDFFAPEYLVNAARDAMGGGDLDPASHWRANFVHRFPLYYSVHRSAFHNPWFGKIWLYPPFGNNGPWFDRIAEYRDEIEQLCFLGPAWAFTTQRAREFMANANAVILLSPTPEWWGHPDGRTGSNLPHMLVYLGDRRTEFLRELQPYGIPLALDFAADLERA